jgi:IS605 OrfB family transposase
MAAEAKKIRNSSKQLKYWPEMTEEMTLTYQTRLQLNEDQAAVLQKCACLLSSAERTLYAEMGKGKTATSCKNEFLRKYGITARQFNACRVNLEGKVSACQASQKQALINLKQQIEVLDKHIKILERKPSKQNILHQKKRRRHMLAQRFSAIEEDLRHKRVHLCFGGKKLFSAQFHLEENGFSSHAAWKAAWEAKRNSEFYALGSKDETAGNQTCTAQVQQDGKLCFRLRLPQALEEKHGKYIELNNICFNYGQEVILAALQHPEGKALSYRFKKDSKSWKLFVATALEKPKSVSIEGNGAIGIDLNSNHIAYVETDRFGNPIDSKVISWSSYGKTNNQLKALTGEICRDIVSKAKETKKPLIIENLDFQKKKLTLKKERNKFARLLSSFAYGLFFLFLIARAYKNGIEVYRVNPAFTSIIGRVNYATRYGLSIHLAAALCIARRYQKFSETPCSPVGKIPDGKGGHVAFVLPVRNRTKHVWHFWGEVKKKISTALAAHNQATDGRSSSPLCSAPGTGNS